MNFVNLVSFLSIRWRQNLVFLWKFWLFVLKFVFVFVRWELRWWYAMNHVLLTLLHITQTAIGQALKKDINTSCVACGFMKTLSISLVVLTRSGSVGKQDFLERYFSFRVSA